MTLCIGFRPQGIQILTLFWDIKRHMGSLATEGFKLCQIMDPGNYTLLFTHLRSHLWWTVDSSSTAFTVPSTWCFTISMQNDGAGFTSIFKSRPIWHPDTAVILVPPPFIEVWNFLLHWRWLIPVKPCLPSWYAQTKQPMWVVYSPESFCHL